MIFTYEEAKSILENRAKSTKKGRYTYAEFHAISTMLAEGISCQIVADCYGLHHATCRLVGVCNGNYHAFICSVPYIRQAKVAYETAQDYLAGEKEEREAVEDEARALRNEKRELTNQLKEARAQTIEKITELQQAWRDINDREQAVRKLRRSLRVAIIGHFAIAGIAIAALLRGIL